MNKVLSKLKNPVKMMLALFLLWVLAKHSLLNVGSLVVFLKSPWRLFFILNLMVLNVLMSAWRWYRLSLIQDMNISYRDTLVATYVGLTFNNLFLGSVGGDLIRVNYLYKRMPQQKIAGTMSVLADRICGLLGIFFALCVLGIAWKSFFDHSIYLSLFLDLCIWMSFSALLGVFMILIASKFNLADKIKDKIQSPRLNELIKVIRIYKRYPLVVLECIGLSMLIQLLLAYIVAVIGGAFTFEGIHFLPYMIANLITQLTSLVPISPGGLGVGEMAFAKSLVHLTGVMGAFATIYLAYRFLTMIFSAPGIFIFLKMSDKKPLSVSMSA